MSILNVNLEQSNLIKSLLKYTACDIADTLLRLNVPNAGYLPNLQLITTNTNESDDVNASIITIAPASTVIFCPKTVSSVDSSIYPQPNIPGGKHWVDLTPPQTILVISQPEHQRCAVLGGILALRMKILDVKGVVVSGRVRDKLELKSLGIPIWAVGTSIVGAAAESKPLATQVKLDINGTIISPGDLVFCDSVNGVVVIPQELVLEVVDMLPTIEEMENRIKKDLKKNLTVFDAFAKHRK